MLDSSPQEEEIFRALAHSTRRAMLQQLSRGSASASSLARPFQMSIQAALQHLDLLESAGLVSSAHEGGLRMCRLEAGALSVVERWIHEILRARG
jgi:DNA-binding transcriptional ArsR family regulator